MDFRRAIPLWIISSWIFLNLMAGSAGAQPSAAPVTATPAAVTTGTHGPAKGVLVIVGGGAMTPEIWQRFILLAGGTSARIVVIPTALEDSGLKDEERTVARLKSLGAQEVTILHTRDPKEADTEKFVAPLKTATGVWFSGGRQWRLADVYLNNRTHAELNAVLERGGVIGGSSAGATIQGSFLVRGDTRGNELMMGDHVTGLGFLKNAAIDQHVLRRNRVFDLIPVIEAHPDLLGIGIDEATAIIVEGDEFEVIGASYVAIYDANRWKDAAGKKQPFYFVGRGQRFDLKTRRVIGQPRQ